jgi:hypothetical protein
MIDPRLVSIWTDDDLRAEIKRQNERANAARIEVREIAAQLSMRHPNATGAKR